MSLSFISTTDCFPEFVSPLLSPVSTLLPLFIICVELNLAATVMATVAPQSKIMNAADKRKFFILLLASRM